MLFINIGLYFYLQFFLFYVVNFKTKEIWFLNSLIDWTSNLRYISFFLRNERRNFATQGVYVWCQLVGVMCLD